MCTPHKSKHKALPDNYYSLKNQNIYEQKNEISSKCVGINPLLSATVSAKLGNT
jgi:hypothetical protein